MYRRQTNCFYSHCFHSFDHLIVFYAFKNHTIIYEASKMYSYLNIFVLSGLAHSARRLLNLFQHNFGIQTGFRPSNYHISFIFWCVSQEDLKNIRHKRYHEINVAVMEVFFRNGMNVDLNHSEEILPLLGIYRIKK